MFYSAILTSIIFILQGADSLKSLIIQVPKIVKNGDTVTLSCNYDLEGVALYTIKWYINDEEFYRYVPKESPPSRAFTMSYINVDIDKSGPSEVTLKDLKRELTGVYKCEVSADAPLFHTEVKSAHMTVVEVPNEPPFLQIEPKKVEIGNKIYATCSTNGSHPPANLTWYINDQRVSPVNGNVRTYPTQTEPEKDSDHLRRSKSRIELIANRSHFTMGPLIVKCEARIYSVWNKFADAFIRDETPFLAPVLLSTSSQTHDDNNNYDIHRFNKSSVINLHSLLNLAVLMHLLLSTHR